MGVDVASVNRSAFDAIREAFEAGDIVGVFPEGGVHDSSHVGKPRSGVAKMALESADSATTNGLELVAFGVPYEAPQTPRSDVAVVIGRPFSLRAWMSEAQPPTAHALSARLHHELLSVARSSRTWPIAEARNRLTAAVAAVLAERRRPLLDTAVNVQGACERLVEESQADELVQWRTIADELCDRVASAGGQPTSARDVARVLDAAGVTSPQAQWPSTVWMLAAGIPALSGLILNGPIQRLGWWNAKRTTLVRTDTMARAILPGLHLILLWWVVLGGLFALGFRAASVSSWWALPVVTVLPRLGDLGLRWWDAARALRLRSRVTRLPDAERAAIRAAADRVRSAWMALPSSHPSSLSFSSSIVSCRSPRGSHDADFDRQSGRRIRRVRDFP